MWVMSICSIPSLDSSPILRPPAQQVSRDGGLAIAVFSLHITRSMFVPSLHAIPTPVSDVFDYILFLLLLFLLLPNTSVASAIPA